MLGQLREIAAQSNLKTIYLADIDKTVFQAGASTSSPAIVSVECDFTSGIGQAICDALTVRFDTEADPEECLRKLPPPKKMLTDCIKSAGGDEALCQKLLRAVREKVQTAPFFAYSEMIASFAATPVLMSCRTRIIMMTAGKEDLTVRQSLMAWCTEFWKIFNDWFYRFHLQFLKIVGGK